MTFGGSRSSSGCGQGGGRGGDRKSFYITCSWPKVREMVWTRSPVLCKCIAAAQQFDSPGTVTQLVAAQPAAAETHQGQQKMTTSASQQACRILQGKLQQDEGTASGAAAMVSRSDGRRGEGGGCHGSSGGGGRSKAGASGAGPRASHRPCAPADVGAAAHGAVSGRAAFGAHLLRGLMLLQACVVANEVDSVSMLRLQALSCSSLQGWEMCRAGRPPLEGPTQPGSLGMRQIAHRRGSSAV